MNKPEHSDRDVIAHQQCEDILEWSKNQPWFNESFILNMLEKDTYAINQRIAINNIWEKFIKD